MKVTYLPEDGKKFIAYEVSKNSIDFNDGDLMFNASKKERDYEVVIDICMDYTGGLVMGTETGDRYVAQLVIPARKYTEEQTEEGTVQKPVPFAMDNCELKLWEMEG